MSDVITHWLDDPALERLLMQAWHLGFNASTERCNGEFPHGLEDNSQADIQKLLQTLKADTVIVTEADANKRIK